MKPIPAVTNVNAAIAACEALIYPDRLPPGTDPLQEAINHARVAFGLDSVAALGRPTVALYEEFKVGQEPAVLVPALDHDAMMLREFRHSVLPRGRVERRLIAALVQHLDRAGFDVVALFDGDCRDEFDLAKDVVARSKDVMELVFNLDECSLRVLKKGIDWEETREEAEQTRNAYRDPEHGIYIVLGNDGWDCVADWNWHDGDPDGFSVAMDKFGDPERFA
jgi:hypothetical protein